MRKGETRKPAEVRASKNSSASSILTWSGCLRTLAGSLRATPLGRFHQFLQHERHQAPVTRNRCGSSKPHCSSLFPCHLPRRPPELFQQAAPQGRRRGQRWQRRRAAWRLSEWLVTAMSFAALGSPKSKSRARALLGTWQQSVRQEVAFEMLMRDIEAMCRLQLSSCLAVGRGTAKLHALQSELCSLHDELVAQKKVDLVSQVSVACEVQVPAVEKRLPSDCGKCDPGLWLKGSKRHTFMNQHLLVNPDALLDKEGDKFCYRVHPKDEIDLRHLLLTTGFSILLPESDLAKAPSGRVLLGGLFMVEDRPGKYRLIYDRRPANREEHSLPWLRLPMGSMIARIRLADAFELRGSGSDLDSYFNRLLQHESALSRSAFGRQVSPNEAAKYGYKFEGPSRQVVAVCGMGSLNSPAIAQETHLKVLEAEGIKTNEFLEWGHQFPRGPLFSGVFYDDLVTMALTRITDVGLSSGPDFDLIQRSKVAYAKASLPLSAAKGFGFAEDVPDPKGSLHYTAWGTEVKSKEGLVGTDLSKRGLLLLIGLRIVISGWANGDLLRRFAGCVVHPFSHRRELSSFFNRFYKYRSSIPDNTWTKLPHDIRDEIASVSLLLSVAHAHIRWPVATNISCSDATPVSDAIVTATVGRTLAESLYDASIHRGKHIPFNASLLQEMEAECAYETDGLTEEVVDSIAWKLQTKRKFQTSTHVNLRELDAILEVGKEAASFSLLPQRLANGTDSLVSLGAHAKGRSPSYRLNSRLRRSVGHYVLGRKVLVNYKVDTKHNAADDPTRDVDIRSPSASNNWVSKHLAPEVASPYMRGDFSSFRGGACREVFAGSAGLTKALDDAGVWVEPPLDAYIDGRYVAACDLDLLETRLKLEHEIDSGMLRYLHFGLPCGGWANANRLNGGTRRLHCPDGGPQPLERELRANRQGEYVSVLALKLASKGGYFTIENPWASSFWSSSSFNWLKSKTTVHLCHIALCSYGHRIPGANRLTFCEKRTGFAANFPEVMLLERRCPGTSPSHQHQRAWGNVRVNGKSISCAKAAGHYPPLLCQALARIVGEKISLSM